MIYNDKFKEKEKRKTDLEKRKGKMDLMR